MTPTVARGLSYGLQVHILRVRYNTHLGEDHVEKAQPRSCRCQFDRVIRWISSSSRGAERRTSRQCFDAPVYCNNLAVATDRLLRAPPCVCTALCMHCLVYAPVPTCMVHLGSFCSTNSLLPSAPGPTHAPDLNNKTRAPALGRFLCAPPSICTALCVHRQPFPHTSCT